jgi:CBS domain-containing protein
MYTRSDLVRDSTTVLPGRNLTHERGTLQSVEHILNQDPRSVPVDDLVIYHGPLLGSMVDRGRVVKAKSNDIGDDAELRDLFPSVFVRSMPMVEADSYMLSAGSVLRFHGVEAALVLAEGLEPLKLGNKCLFVGGYGVLSRLLKAQPEEYYKTLFEPCSKSAMALDSITADQKLGDLLRLFTASGFGFAVLKEGRLCSLIGLSDIVPLYEDGSIATDLRVRDVASQRISVDKGTSIKDALQLMFDRRIRRVFIGDSGSYVSDREIISYMLSPDRLQKVRDSSSVMLDGDIRDVGPIDADVTKGGLSLRDAAGALKLSQGNALVCKEGVVSSWDLVVKPFVMQRLSVRRQLSGAAPSIVETGR